MSLSLLSSSANEYNLKDYAFLFNSLAISSPISSTRRVTVLHDKIIFPNLALLSGHKRPAVSTVHSFKKLTFEGRLASLC